MRSTRVVFGLVLVLALSRCTHSAAQSARSRAGGGVTGRWMGQTGRDLVGPSSQPAPDGVEDVQVALKGLPANRSIRSAVLTGLGGGEWTYNRPGNSWCCVIERAAGSPTADLFFEPGGEEKGRPFQLRLELDDGRTIAIDIRGGRSSPSKRMASARLQVVWKGQDGGDFTGLGAAVGPDGYQDVRLGLSGIVANAPIQSVDVRSSGKAAWCAGPNPKRLDNAELVRSPAEGGSTAELWLQPRANLAGQALRVTLRYGDGRTDQADLRAGECDPHKAVPPPPAPRLVGNNVRSRWVGQNGENRVGPGDVNVELTGLPTRPAIAALALSDGASGSWMEKKTDVPFTGEPYALPLSLELAGNDPTSGVLRFPPVRDESGRSLMLRLVLTDGSSTLVTIPGGPCDPGLRGNEGPQPTSIVARPGDDLQALVDHYGQVRLAAGVHELRQPLTITRAVDLKGEPGSTLLFRQPPSGDPWTAAIKLRHGRSVLEGFAVRFAGPIRWREGTNDGPAVIGTTDNFDPPQRELLADIQVLGLDVQAPPSGKGKGWVAAPHLLRLRGASCGRIERNVLVGGPIEFWGGPWTVVDNTFQGTPAGSSSPSVFVAHEPLDLVIARNTASSPPDAGKTWRFLVMVGGGHNVTVESNTISGIGPKDNDTIPSANAPEIVMTESYAIRFEGKPLQVAADGRIIQIPPPQGEPPRTGDIVALLDGPEAGQWRRVVQALDERTLLVEPPLPPTTGVISVTRGFDGLSITKNRIDARGGSVALPLLLAGNHFGTRVVENHILGGGDAFRIVACPTERPNGWGWSRAPMLGLILENNSVADSLRGGLIAVEQNDRARTTSGRVYGSVTLRSNRFHWSTAAPAPARAQARARERLGFTVGEPDADPAALRVVLDGNLASAPDTTTPAVLRVASASLGGRAIRQQRFSLTWKPTR